MSRPSVSLFVSVALIASLLNGCDSKSPGASSRQQTVSLEDAKKGGKNSGDSGNYASTGDGATDAEGKEALPPQIVSGAYLSCAITPEEDLIACQVEDNEATPVDIPASLNVEWQLVTPNGPSENISRTVEATRSGVETTFFLPIPASSREKELRMKTSDGTTSVNLSFAIANLYKPSSTIAMQASSFSDSAANEGYFDFVQGFALGDGSAQLDKDNCTDSAAQTEPVGTKTVPLSFSERQDGISIYMRSICSLQTSAATVTIEGPAPFKTLTTRLTPGLRDITIAKKLVMEKGEYRVTFKNSGRLPDGSIDTFSFSELTLSRSSQ